MRQKAGRITAAGMTKEVTFEPADGPINNLVDEAYHSKYHGSLYLSAMSGTRARFATVKVMTREANSCLSSTRRHKLPPLKLGANN